MTEKKNLRIREELAAHDMKIWQLADLLGIHVNTLYIKLRHELPEAEQARMIELIRQEEGKQN